MIKKEEIHKEVSDVLQVDQEQQEVVQEQQEVVQEQQEVVQEQQEVVQEQQEVVQEQQEVVQEQQEVVQEQQEVVQEQQEVAQEQENIEEKKEHQVDDFDIDGSDFDDQYDQKERKELESLYENTIKQAPEKQLIKGTVVLVTDSDVIVNIGFKSDGLIPRSEFRDTPDLKVGDEVEVYLEEQENTNGQLVLSKRKAKIVKAWEAIQKALDEDQVLEGFVKRRTKGGLIMDIFGVEAFLPGSQIDIKPIRDFDIYVNKSMEVKVVKINYDNDNVVVSHKILIEKDLEKQKAEILNKLEKGQVLEGVIKNMTHFGVFIDLGGVDGLLHITDISWGRISHPEELLQLDQKIDVVVLDFDDEKQRISLGLKQLTGHPWDSLDKDLDVGSKVTGKIANVEDYGAFLEIIPGVEGLIHVSEMSWSQHLRNPSDFTAVGKEIEAVILTLDRKDRKMSLGIKQLTEDPWTKQDVLTKYAIDTEHKGMVRNLTSYGLFIELEEGIDGLVHVSDLSWTKRIKHPSEYVKMGDELEVKVLDLDVKNRRLALSHKHLQENPWDTFETVFTKGSVHKCAITSINDKIVTLELPYGLEGQTSPKNIKKEDGTLAVEGETLDFRVIEFSKDSKRIMLSHTSVFKEDPKQTKSKTTTKKRINKIQQEAEKSTLGDIETLSNLKNKMSDEKK